MSHYCHISRENLHHWFIYCPYYILGNKFTQLFLLLIISTLCCCLVGGCETFAFQATYACFVIILSHYHSILAADFIVGERPT